MLGNKNNQPAGFVSACGKAIEKRVVQLWQNHLVVTKGALSTTSHQLLKRPVVFSLP